MRPRSLLPSALLWLGCLAGAGAARAELVVMADGSFLKVLSYELLDGERMRLALPRGGSMTLPLVRIERVVEDEVPWPSEEPPPELVEEAQPEPTFSIAFAEEDEMPATPYGELIFAVARKHDLNPALIAAVVRAESGFQATAVSHKGACGLMQLMPATGRRFGLAHRELFDPKKNLDAGATYLKWLLGRFDSDVRLALAAYNAGEGTVDRYRGVPPFRETRNYVRRIFGYLGLEELADVPGGATAATAVGR